MPHPTEAQLAAYRRQRDTPQGQFELNASRERLARKQRPIRTPPFWRRPPPGQKWPAKTPFIAVMLPDTHDMRIVVTLRETDADPFDDDGKQHADWVWLQHNGKRVYA